MTIRTSFPGNLIADNLERRLSALTSLDQMLCDQIDAISGLQQEITYARKLLSERCGVPDADAIETYLSPEALVLKEATRKRATARGKDKVHPEPEKAVPSEKPVSASARRERSLRALIAGR